MLRTVFRFHPSFKHEREYRGKILRFSIHKKIRSALIFSEGIKISPLPE